MASKKEYNGRSGREKRRVKVLYLLDYLHGFGGTERHIFQLATGLDPDKFACTVCPMDYRQEVADYFSDAGIDVVPMHFVRIYTPDGLRQIYQLSRLLKERQFDIIQTFNVASDIVGIIAGKLAGVPVIISSRRDMGGYREKHHLAVTRILNRYVTRFIAVCDAAADQVVKQEGISPERITTVYNGFDPTVLAAVNPDVVEEIRPRLGIKPGDFVLGYIAHFRPEKGHQVLFEALRRLTSTIPRIKLLAIGLGPTLPDIERFIQENSLQEHAILAGYIKNVFDHICLMDICCFTPVSNEGFSNALLEQMSMAKPIVATDVGGNAEIIEHQVSGLVVPPNDAGALVEAIQYLYHHPEERRRMSENARARVPEKFGMDLMLSQTAALYDKLLGLPTSVEPAQTVFS